MIVECLQEMSFAREVEELRQAAREREVALTQQLSFSKRAVLEATSRANRLEEESDFLRKKFYLLLAKHNHEVRSPILISINGFTKYYSTL